ncbi:hypothetical protein C8A03DRAFT_15006 [Achaetomium macrosporum]|uniref:Uncharacterized protein n=1 Tax=Achaetomium macrosporum TaxID=79813 RepID=A0AAN7H7C7_9PEZI|nr:hypothetical protein C8A03DRAFT_15006 [Achaetomium macrosporum]
MKRVLEAVLTVQDDISALLKGLGPVHVRTVPVNRVGARPSWKPECGRQFGKRAFVKTIQSQVKTLYKRSGICFVEARTCVKLACALDGAISWCNDGDKPITRSCSDIAKDAKLVMTRCKHGHPKHGISWTRGQIRDSETSRVVVNKAVC